MLTRAAGGRNPKEASNDNLTAAPSPPYRVEGAGRWTQAGRKRTEELAAASAWALARHQYDISTPAVIANRANTNRRTVPPDE